MKFSYRLRLLIIAGLCPLFSLAQSNYKQGFVINLKGDTLKGYIDLKEWGSNPKNINFKTSLDKSSPQTLGVTDINYFEIPMVIAYRGFTTSISLDETSIQKLSFGRDTSSKIDNVFLKVEQQGGNVTLYSYQDNLKTRYYIYDKQANNVNELIYRVYHVTNEKSNSATVNQDAYKQQLLLIAEKFDTYNESLKNLIEQADYLESDLKAICRKINNAKKEDNADHKKYIRFFAGGGLGFNTINVTGNFPLYNATKSYNSIAPKLSVGFNFYPVPEVGKSLLKLELAYTSASYKTVFNQAYYSPEEKTTYSFLQHTISFIPQFQYSIYNTDPFKFYVDAGLSINFSSYDGDNVYNSLTTNNQTNFLGLNDRWLSIPIKAGIILKKHLDISLVYIVPTSISDNVAGTRQTFNYSLTLNTLQAGVSYIF